MRSPADFLHLPYTRDLTEGGIAFALRSLSYNSISYDRISRMAAGVAVELAFRRHLSQQNIPFEIIGAAPFTDRNRHDVSLGGYRCDIKSFLISDREQIASIRREPETLLNAPALVPSDIDAAEGHLDKDLYIFAFVTGLKTASQRDIKKVMDTNQPHCFMHIMPERWRTPAHWNPLGGLILKSEANAAIEVEISGLDQARGYLTRRVELPPRKRILVKDPFYSISAIHIKNDSTARLGIVIQNQSHIITPTDWKNIWVYGMDIILAGFITRGEFRQHARSIPPQTKVFQYNHTQVKNLAVQISSLKAMDGLFERASKITK